MRFLKLAACFLILVEPALAAVKITSTRSTFDFTLLEAPPESGIDRVSGQWVQQVEVSECATYTVKSQFDMIFHMSNGTEIKLNRAQESREDRTGDAFSFAILDKENDEIKEDTVGTALRSDGQVVLKTTKTDQATFKHSGDALFPVEFVRSLLVKATSGLKKTESLLLEGYEGGKLAYLVKTEIGPEQPIPQASAGVTVSLDAQKLRRWSFKNDFVRKPVFGEQKTSDKSDYSNEFVMFENGVAKDFVFRLGFATVKGELSDLIFLDPTPC